MLIPVIILLALIYFIWHSDKLYYQPCELHLAEEDQWTPSQVRQAAKKASGKDTHLMKVEDLPPKTGRKYIIVGGVSCLHPTHKFKLHVIGAHYICMTRPDS
jgi:hypothetical protein